MNNWTTFLIALASGGAVTAVITIIANRKKGKADVSDILVKKALDIEAVATSRYLDVSESLKISEDRAKAAEEKVIAAEILIAEARRETEKLRQENEAVRQKKQEYREHIVTLHRLMDTYHIVYPKINID